LILLALIYHCTAVAYRVGGTLRVVRASVVRVGNASTSSAQGKAGAGGGLGWDSVEVRVSCRVLPAPDTTELELVYRVTPSADLIVSATLSPPLPPSSSSSSSSSSSNAAGGSGDGVVGLGFALQPGKTVALHNTSTATHLDVEGNEVLKSGIHLLIETNTCFCCLSGVKVW
jgi:hypothetical protein